MVAEKLACVRGPRLVRPQIMGPKSAGVLTLLLASAPCLARASPPPAEPPLLSGTTSRDDAGVLPPQPMPGTPPPVPPAPVPGAPRLHVEATSPGVTLFEVSQAAAVFGARGTSYGVFTRPICHVPCDRIVDGRAGQSFYFGGEGVTPSSSFQLAGHSGEVAASVTPGSARARFGGVVMTGLGATAILTGAIMLPIGARYSETDDLGVTTNVVSVPMVAGGAALAAAGVGLLIGGIVTLVKSRTAVTFAERSVAVAF